jgi:iron(III) transport system permease protein
MALTLSTPHRWLARLGVWGVSLILAMPVISIALQFSQPSDGVWTHLASTVLTGYVINSALLSIGVALMATVFGTLSAWFVTMTDLPLRTTLRWALLLPLAVPAYLMAYVYTDLLDVYGPLQSWLRAMFGGTVPDWGAPSIRNLPGAILMFGFVLYPYVFLLSRTAFHDACGTIQGAGRSLGGSTWRVFWRVTLPMARPAIAAGVFLAVMETLADYGTVEYFGVPTFTTGIYRAWFGMGAPIASAQLAACLLFVVLLLITVERVARGGRRFHAATASAPLAPITLRPATKVLGLLFCGGLITLGFALPAGYLAYLAASIGDPLLGRRFMWFITNTLTVAATAAVVTTAFALLTTSLLRARDDWANRLATTVAGMGYAVPGTVIAVGILLALSTIDDGLGAIYDVMGSIAPNVFLTGSLAMLVFAYVVRFFAVAQGSVQAGFARISPKLDLAARSLGRRQPTVTWQIHIPLLRGGLAAAALLVFVDVAKELPATMILRPFNFETLALRVYRLASDERLAEASTAALLIVLVGILPVIILSQAASAGQAEHR